MADFHNITTLTVKQHQQKNNNKQYVHLDSLFLVSPIENMSCNRKNSIQKDSNDFLKTIENKNIAKILEFT